MKSKIVYNLIKDYLAFRYQRVVLDSKYSKWEQVIAGVLQGSILGPHFFLIYINDLTDDLKCNVKLYPDDTSLFTIVHDAKEAADNLDYDIERIKDKLLGSSMEDVFNPDPTKQAVEVTFSKKRTPTVHPPIYFNNIQVANVPEQKHLGLILGSEFHLTVILISKYQKQGKE